MRKGEEKRRDIGEGEEVQFDQHASPYVYVRMDQGSML